MADGFPTWVRIESWEKHNPRKEFKSTSWLRLENGLFEDPDMYGFTHGEILFWVYLLCVSSKKYSPTIRFNVEHAERIGRFDRETIQSGIDKLVKLGFISITNVGHERERHAHATHTPRARVRDVSLRNERTNERNDTNVTNEKALCETADAD